MITEYQRQLMKHTVSGPNRNWFGTGFNCKDSVEFEKLVVLELATKETPPAWMGDDVIYRLTQKGKELISK
jgi:hypothetical protein